MPGVRGAATAFPGTRLRAGNRPFTPLAVLLATAGAVTASAVLFWIDRRLPLELYGIPGLPLVVGLAMSAVGAIVLRRISDQVVGWILATAGLTLAVASTAQLYALAGERALPAALPGDHFAGWLGTWLYLPAVALVTAFLAILFPDGPPRGRLWKAVLVVMTAVTIATIGAIAARALMLAGQRVDLSGQLPGAALPGDDLLGSLFNAWYVVLAVEMVVAGAAVVLRLWRSRGTDRQQMKLFLYSVGAMVAALLAGEALQPLPGRWAIEAGNAIFVLALLGFPVAIGLAILRHGLYEIDAVITSTLVYGALGAFIVVAYVAVVVGLGTFIGSTAGGGLALSIALTGAVAVVFQPLKRRLELLAAKLVYGKRSTPYQVLAQLARRLAETMATEDVIPRLAEAAALAVGAERCQVRVFASDGSPIVRSWPLGNDGAGTFSWIGSIEHAGERVGELAIQKAANDPLSPTEDALLADLALQAGPALQNFRLTARLRQQRAELEASRARIVRAEDEGRRRLERDIHDGTQQQLLALLARVQLGRRQLNRDPGEADRSLEEALEMGRQALTDLRDLVAGIHPAVLTDSGLVAAIEARTARIPLSARVHLLGVGREDRYSQECEAAAYFVVCEALTNVIKHSGAHEADISLARRDGSLAVEVVDQGRGYEPTALGSGLQGIRDRVEALGGSFSIENSRDRGTRLLATIPVGVGRG